MSGIYLVLWNQKIPLQPTKGGWPHITIAYTGKTMNLEDLVTVANKAMVVFSMKTVILNDPYINSFIEKGVERHDVLLNVNYEIKTIIELFRKDIKIKYPNSEFVMRNPHVTAGIFYDIESAIKFKQDFSEPISMTITGVTIN
jgi:hypothetical protein